MRKKSRVNHRQFMCFRWLFSSFSFELWIILIVHLSNWWSCFFAISLTVDNDISYLSKMNEEAMKICILLRSAQPFHTFSTLKVQKIFQFSSSLFPMQNMKRPSILCGVYCWLGDRLCLRQTESLWESCRQPLQEVSLAKCGRINLRV